jgi:hypothetical protein
LFLGRPQLQPSLPATLSITHGGEMTGLVVEGMNKPSSVSLFMETEWACSASAVSTRAVTRGVAASTTAHLINSRQWTSWHCTFGRRSSSCQVDPDADLLRGCSCAERRSTAATPPMAAAAAPQQQHQLHWAAQDQATSLGEPKATRSGVADKHALGVTQSAPLLQGADSRTPIKATLGRGLQKNDKSQTDSSRSSLALCRGSPWWERGSWQEHQGVLVNIRYKMDSHQIRGNRQDRFPPMHRAARLAQYGRRGGAH